MDLVVGWWGGPPWTVVGVGDGRGCLHGLCHGGEAATVATSMDLTVDDGGVLWMVGSRQGWEGCRCGWEGHRRGIVGAVGVRSWGGAAPPLVSRPPQPSCCMPG